MFKKEILFSETGYNVVGYWTFNEAGPEKGYIFFKIEGI